MRVTEDKTIAPNFMEKESILLVTFYTPLNFGNKDCQELQLRELLLYSPEGLRAALKDVEYLCSH